MMRSAISLLYQEQIARVLQEHPEPPDLPSLPEDLALMLRGVTDDAVSAEELRRFLQVLLETADPPRALNHLRRFVNLGPGPHTLWERWQKHPQTLPWTLTLVAASSFLSDLICQHPDWLFRLLDETMTAPPPAAQALTDVLTQHLQGVTSEDAVASGLRCFTQQHLLRIGARDLNALADVEETTADLSALADCVVQMALDTCQKALQVQHGQPTYTDASGQVQPCHFCVIGMGKLGAYELNFSSDIDLMFVYTSYEGQTTGVWREGECHGQLSNHEYFITLSRRLTNLVGGNGPDGHAFRVDLRLRPNGTQGQLAVSLLSYEAYYTRLGQTWEKMALLKARPIVGDVQLGESFMALIHPFVYERHLDPEGLQRIRSMKQEIDILIADKEQSRTNVKLGLGGIREIEFFIQILQLVFAGRQPQLQERQSLRALTHLLDAGLIPDEVETTLRQAYCYLRRLEHLLQMDQGSQTHTFPRREDSQLRLARLCGFADWETFYRDYLERTEAVHAIFRRAFESHDPASLSLPVSDPES
jgi:glutamate-ammonia-ligase adenylyltransferase